MALTPGTRLGNYEVVGAVGAGGMGEVYRARDLKLGRDVAIKVVRSDVALEADDIISPRLVRHVVHEKTEPWARSASRAWLFSCIHFGSEPITLLPGSPA